MSNFLLPERSSHWYDSTGKPVYEVPNISKGGMRPTTITDAKKLNLVPSVTSIQGVVVKPALENWKALQYVLSSLTLPKNPGETQDDFARRVVTDANSEGRRAADFGTNLHALAEMYLDNRLPDTLSSTEQEFLGGVMLWIEKHEFKPEKLEISFANVELGFGGRIDFTGWVRNVKNNLQSFYEPVYVVGDWKSQGSKVGQPLRFYQDWAVQLAAYRRGMGIEAELLSVCISSTEPGRVEEVIWDAPWAWGVFEACKRIYFSPLGPGAGLMDRKILYDEDLG